MTDDEILVLGLMFLTRLLTDRELRANIRTDGHCPTADETSDFRIPADVSGQPDDIRSPMLYPAELRAQVPIVAGRQKNIHSPTTACGPGFES